MKVSQNGTRAIVHHLKTLLKYEPAYLLGQVIPFLSRATQKRFVPFTHGKSYSLKFVWIMLTYRCNLRCEMCGLWGSEGIWKNLASKKLQEELPPDTIEKFLDEVAPWKPMVLLTGGEPMLYPHWSRIARYAKSRKLRVAMSTNGMGLKSQAKEATRFLDVLEISMDGPDKIHDLVRHKEQSFKTIQEGIAALCALKNSTKPTPYLNISLTINNLNFSAIEQFVQMLEQQNFPLHRLTIRHLEFITDAALHAHQKLLEKEFQRKQSVFAGYRYTVSPELQDQLPVLLQKLLHTKLYKSGKITFEPPLHPEEATHFYNDPSYIPTRFRKCFSPWLGVSLLPSGELWICPDYPVGNIQEDTFRNLWNNKKARMFRQRLAQKGLLPACRTCASLYIY